MKILAVCQYYAPEPMRFPDMCEEFVRRGHEVTVLTGVPNYPMGKIYAGYAHGRRRDETINGVHVIRCATVPRGERKIARLLNYYSYAISASRRARKLPADFDVVFVNQQSPVMMAWPAMAYKKKHKKPIVLYCMDLWPASLAIGGVRGGLLYQWFYRESAKVYHAADKILITSSSFADYFEKAFGITDTAYLPQYAEDTFTPEQCRKKPDDYIDLMFAGNVGTAQSVDTIIKAAALCKDIPNLRWHIVGDGKEIGNMKRLAKELDAPVAFHGRQPLAEMPEYYSMADAMLVTMQKDPIISMTLPGKVQSYMAAGKPIIGSIDGETANVVREAMCGFVGEAENENELAANVRNFVALNIYERVKLGENALKLYANSFSRRGFADGINAALRKMLEYAY